MTQFDVLVFQRAATSKLTTRLLATFCLFHTYTFLHNIKILRKETQIMQKYAHEMFGFELKRLLSYQQQWVMILKKRAVSGQTESRARVVYQVITRPSI